MAKEETNHFLPVVTRTVTTRWLLLCCAGAAAVYLLATRGGETPPPSPRQSGVAREVPVVAAKATVGSIPVYLSGLGTVTPLNTVIVKSRVDGQLVRVLFREGQFVQAGQLLAEIDPRRQSVW